MTLWITEFEQTDRFDSCKIFVGTLRLRHHFAFIPQENFFKEVNNLVNLLSKSWMVL